MRPVVLTFARYYLPGYRAGGPIRSIANLVELLGDEFEFRVVTLDRDLGDERPYPGIRPDTWMRLGKGWVYYVSQDRFSFRNAAAILNSTPHNLIYLNSFFDPRFTQQVLICWRFGKNVRRPIVLAPRGEFSAGALRIKRIKKIVFIMMIKALRIYQGLVWQASSALEAEDILRELSVGRRSGLGGMISITGNLVVAPDLVPSRDESGPECIPTTARKLGGPLRVCFLSRISPMKNLDYALRLLALVRVAVRFCIYGPIEDAAYWAECQSLIAALPPNIHVEYMGMVEHPHVVQTLAQHDVFLFPTRGENFGHVIHEALRAGLTLIISNNTPWKQLEENGVGWALPLENPAAFAQRIAHVASWTSQDYFRVANDARALASQVSNTPDVIDANRNLFLNLIKKNAQN